MVASVKSFVRFCFFLVGGHVFFCWLPCVFGCDILFILCTSLLPSVLLFSLPYAISFSCATQHFFSSATLFFSLLLPCATYISFLAIHFFYPCHAQRYCFLFPALVYIFFCAALFSFLLPSAFFFWLILLLYTIPFIFFPLCLFFFFTLRKLSSY